MSDAQFHETRMARTFLAVATHPESGPPNSAVLRGVAKEPVMLATHKMVDYRSGVLFVLATAPSLLELRQNFGPHAELDLGKCVLETLTPTAIAGRHGVNRAKKVVQNQSN